MQSKENINFYKFRIFIFILGFFLIIFSETTIRFTSININENLKILLLPIIIFIVLYSLFIFKFQLKIKNIK